MRDFGQEAAAQPDKKYNYNFDSIVRSYMMRNSSLTSPAERR